MFYFKFQIVHVSENGFPPEVYVWGGNTEGQLGAGQHGEENIFKPIKLNTTFNVSITPPAGSSVPFI